jgi:heat shock protein HslJ
VLGKEKKPRNFNKPRLNLKFWHGCSFCATKTVNMKRLIFVLPLCVLLANCSSSKKTTAPPAGPGISNVNVATGGAPATAVNANAQSSPDKRDWAYHAKNDTSLSGSWVLQGMVSASGSWTALQSASTATDTATATTGTDTSATATTSMGTTGTQGTTGTMTKGKTKHKTKTNSRALYDSARARLAINTQSAPSTIDSSLLGPYKYWGNTPVLNINASNRVFYGSTGCNSMSGSFNFSGNDIQFGRSINTSKMNCNDYDEASFIAALKKVDNYTLNGTQLDLKQGNTVLLTFQRRS